MTVPASTKTVTIADLFCGAGGSSTGARIALRSLGMSMDLLCVNHWNVAIDTHQINHPEARHYCQDLATLRPRIAVPDGCLDLLMASPTCTYHSRARGGRPTSDQQRMDPWHIVTWLTELRVRCLIIENVPEFVDWGPIDTETGKPIKNRKGEYFRAWRCAVEALGFVTDWKVLNAADYGEATTRKRFFMLARSDGDPIRWPRATHAPRNTLSDLEPWRAARDIIDWSLHGRSIFDRKKPLAAKTLARIMAGAVKYRWPEPYLVVLRRHMDGKSLDDPIPALTAGGTHVGLAQPFIYNGRKNAKPIDVESGQVPTLDTKGGVWMAEPFILSQASGGAPRGVEEPAPTILTGGASAMVHPGCARPALISPYYGGGSGETCSNADDPLPTVTTKGRFGMVVPITHHDDSNRAREVEEPLPTITSANRGELAFIAAAFGEREGQAPRIHSVDEPSPTICAQGRVNLVLGRDFDIYYRMLQPHELAGAMGFDAAEAEYEFAGTKTDIIRQIGNAVPVRLAAALVGAMMVPPHALREAAE
jgi:DNA (cytosine-5)-methyltransferase 1